MKKKFSNNKGVSLITLVITIIVIIILAAIVLFTSLTTVDNANYATFVSEYDEINSGTQAKLKNNILNGKSEEERNAGFKKVKIENAPGSFVSVSDGAIEGYLVDLDTIKVTGTKTGKGEVINETVTFGEDDVYIYDDEGKVYYAKGYSDGEGQPKYKLDEELNLAQKPTIDSIDVILSEDKSIATIKVVARPGNSGELTVTADGKTATKTGDNTYEIKVNKNGKILVIAKEAGGSSVSQEVEITGIEKPKCLLNYDANGGSNAPASEEFEEGKRVTISSTQPTRSGYKFLGWSEDRGATTATYRAGGTYSKGISTTLYAVWKSTTLETIPTVKMADYAYGETPSTPQISANPGNGTVTYYYATSSTGNGTAWSSSVKLDAGTYYMYAKITNMADYDDVQTERTSFKVTQAKGSIGWEKSSVTTTLKSTSFENKFSKTGDGTVTFSSTNTNVAEVGTNGNVTVKGAGTTEIKATVADSTNYTYENKTASYTLTVGKAEITSAKVTMSGYTYGQTPSEPKITGNAGNGTVTYYYNSSNTNSGGTVWSGISSTSLNAGTYYIYAVIAETDNYKAFTTKATSFTIAKATTGSISFDKTTVTKTTNDEYFTNAITNNGDGKVSYTSSNTSVAIVDENGKVTIKSEGETTITATVTNGTNYTYTNNTASYTLKVEVPVYYLMGRINGTSPVIGSSTYYASSIKTITFQKTKNAQEEYKDSVISYWDVSASKNGTVMAYIVKNAENTKYYDLYICADIGEKGKLMAPEDSTCLFCNYSNCTAINNLNLLDTSNVTNMDSMFFGCCSLTSLDVSKFDTSQVTDMNAMFAGCGNLKSLDVSKFDTSQVTDMSGMFSSCGSLNNLDLSNFDTANVLYMDYMFCSSSEIIKLDLSSFNTKNVKSMSFMFSVYELDQVYNLEELILSEKFLTTSVENMRCMFAGCTQLTNLDVSSWDTSQVTDMRGMFYDCEQLTNLDVSSWDTSKVTDMTTMFGQCSRLTRLDVSGWNTSKVTNMRGMFSWCNNLTNLNVTNFDTSKVTDMSFMFDACSKLTSLDVSNFNTSQVTDMSYMFCYYQLTNLDLSNFDTSSVTNMSSMFYSCGRLTNLKLGDKFDKLSSSNMFDKCSKLTSIITTCTEPMTLSTDIGLNNDCILYVLNEKAEKDFESGENYLTVFGSDNDVVRDDGTTDIYRIRTIMELVGDSEVSVEIGGTYSESGVTVAGMNANEDGMYTPYGYTVSSSIKNRSGNTVNEIDTSRAGTYTITYKLFDASGEVEGAEVSRTIKVTMIHSVANGPVLNTSEMKAVYWNEYGDEFETTSFELAQTEEGTIYNTTLYNYNYSFDDDIYELGTDTYDVEWALKPRWANAKTTEDGSYWVWIPRYAYKITYYTGNDKKTVSETKTQYGSIDVIFLKGTSNNEYIDKNGDTQTLPKDYIVHPAFQAMSEEEATEGNRLGKWSEELTGIWVAKYEASQETSTDGTTWIARNITSGDTGNILTTNASNAINGSTSSTDETKVRVVSKPSVNSWRYIENKYIYQNCLKMSKDLNTHQMKNSERGAVAYLTYSVYGRNGNELSVNQCLNFYTGAGPSVNAIYGYTYTCSENKLNSTYGWKTSLGKLASTTGNVYGVYDMSGGAWERLASYVNNGHNNLITYGYDSTNTGYNLVEVDNKNVGIDALKTKQVYPSTVSDGSNAQLADYNLCEKDGKLVIYGDAGYETSIYYTDGYSNWCDDVADFPYSADPFFGYGGSARHTYHAGVFGFSPSYGSANYDYSGFRPVICITSSK